MNLKHYEEAVLKVVSDAGGSITFDQFDEATATTMVVNGNTVRGPCLGPVPPDWLFCGWGLPSHLHKRNMWRIAAMEAIGKKLLRSPKKSNVYILTKKGHAALAQCPEQLVCTQ